MPKNVFKKGNPGGPGRPKGTRSVALEIIYEVFDKYGKAGFRKEMVALVKKNPVAYYLKFIQPIQPKEFELSGRDGAPLVPLFTGQDKGL